MRDPKLYRTYSLLVPEMLFGVNIIHSFHSLFLKLINLLLIVGAIKEEFYRISWFPWNLLYAVGYLGGVPSCTYTAPEFLAG